MFKHTPIVEVICRSQFCRATVVVALFLLPGLAAAESYYVDFADGNDANNGLSMNSPWKTIPGTYKTDGSGYLRTSWGSIRSSGAANRIQDNSILTIKRGTTHSSAAGGFVWLAAGSSGFWLPGCTNLTIRSDASWGTGSTATIDGDGMTVGIALVVSQLDGLTVQNLSINNSSRAGWQAKEHSGDSSPLTNLVFDSCTFYNNGTGFLTDSAGSGDGQLALRKVLGFTIKNCLLDGGSNFVNGILLGDTYYQAHGGLVTGCTATNHQGSLVGNDSGIGFKAQNGQVVFTNCFSAFNLKGFDLGEERNVGYSSSNIMYTVVNCTALSNAWGLNFSGPARQYAGSINWYAINNLFMGNSVAGMNTYSGPHNLYIVHNLFENNGASTNGSPRYDNAQLITSPDVPTDIGTIQTYVFNNVFRGQQNSGGKYGDPAIFLNWYFASANRYTLISDYNSYQQTGSNTLFCLWSAYSSGFEAFSFGPNGPGHASGNWYSKYGNSTTPPALGTGHYHADTHSKGTGCTDTTLPPLNASYVPTNSYSGLNLSTQPWYIAEMGVDRAGVARTGWDIGAYEASSRLPGLPEAETYYVDFADGNDANNGLSMNSPWKTIPGTYKTDGSGYLRTSWGSIRSSGVANRIQDNSILTIKRGTTHSSAAGGFVWLAAGSSGFWLPGCTNLTIRSDASWGTGSSATIDGDGMTVGIALVVSQLDGLIVQNLSINNSSKGGWQAKEHSGDSSPLTNLVFDSCTFYNNGTGFLTDSAGSGYGQLALRKVLGFTIRNCSFDGGNNFINGIVLGETYYQAHGGLITGCTATNHQGSLIGNDCGIGFKAQNGQVVFTNCFSAFNLKGFDLGEERNVGYSSSNIMYTVVNCVALSNAWGLNFSGPARQYAGSINWYAINNLFMGNSVAGMNTYSGPHNLYIVHNLFENNGASTNGSPKYDNAQLITSPDVPTDIGAIQTYVFNNVFRGQQNSGGKYGDPAIFLNWYFASANRYTLISDYNSYQQTGSNTLFCLWSAYSSGFEAFSFGPNGPGHASGNWYSKYGNSTTPPTLGTGHYHADTHSKGTGCTDTTLPPLNASYAPTNSYSGLNLSTQPWYIAEMGVDRAGAARTGWDIGVFDYPRQTRPAPAGGLHTIPQDVAVGGKP